VLARVHLATILVEGPECVPEQTCRVILLFERDETFPVLAERSGHARGDLMSSEERRESTAACHWLDRLAEPLFGREGDGK